jgi:hypothetical protein
MQITEIIEILKKWSEIFFEKFTWGDIFAPMHETNADGPLVPVRKQPGLKGEPLVAHI